MLDLSAALWGTLNGPLCMPLSLIFYENLANRDSLITSINLMLPEGQDILVSSDVSKAFTELNKVLILTVNNEVDALDELAGRREALLQRESTAILFLLRQSIAHEHLSDPKIAGLISWLRGRIIDPIELSQIDIEQERLEFAKKTSLEVEEWMSQWRSGSLPPTLDNQLWFHHALLLLGTP